MNADLEHATALARAAAQAILDVKAEARASSQQKADQSPVTAADLAADRVLRDGLAGDVVVSEEAWTGMRVPQSGRVWIVDPLDGTEDFIAGRPDYVVQVGLVVDGVPRLGVICQPETGRVWRGVVGDGYCESIVRGSDAAGVDVVTRRSFTAAPLARPPRIAVSVSHPSALVDFIAKELGGVVVPIGSVGLKIGLLVDGGADAYVTGSRRIKVWDTLAPAAVMLAAGGVATTLSQQPIDYAGAIVHDDGVCMWSAAVRDALLPRLEDALARFNRAP